MINVVDICHYAEQITKTEKKPNVQNRIHTFFICSHLDFSSSIFECKSFSQFALISSRRLSISASYYKGNKMHSFYHPQTKLWESNVFTPVCHSVKGGAVRYPLLVSDTLPERTWDQTGSDHHNPPERTWDQGRKRYYNPSSRTRKSGGTHPTGMLSCVFNEVLGSSSSKS